jgi:predicted nuclease with TOPRIM domain
MTDLSRRSFFNDFFLKSTINLIAELQEAYTEVKTEFEEFSAEAKNKQDYFDSFESAYPLISESSYFLEDEVARLGVDTKGMTQLEIVKEIYNRNKQQVEHQ